MATCLPCTRPPAWRGSNVQARQRYSCLFGSDLRSMRRPASQHQSPDEAFEQNDPTSVPDRLSTSPVRKSNGPHPRGATASMRAARARHRCVRRDRPLARADQPCVQMRHSCPYAHRACPHRCPRLGQHAICRGVRIQADPRIQPVVGRFRRTRRACSGGPTVARLVAPAPGIA
jgi:hypothetical protein